MKGSYNRRYHHRCCKGVLSYTPRLLLAIGFYSFNALCLLLFYLRPNLLIHELYTLPLVLISCFMALSILTSDFLEPSLSVISRSMLGISDRLSGMTLLALGNGISDITSTYQLMKTDTASLSLGELVGGMFFLITVIVGLMSLLRTIGLVKNPSPASSLGYQFETVTEDEGYSEGLEYYRADFVQDIGTLVVTIVICIFALKNGKLDLPRSLGLILAYFVLAGMVILRQIMDGECPIFASSSEEETIDDGLHRVRTIEELNEVLDNIEEGTSTVTGPLRGIDPTAMDKYRINLSKFEEEEFIRSEVIKQNIRNHLRRNRHGWMRLTLQDCLAIWENSSVFSSDREPSFSNETPILTNFTDNNRDNSISLDYGTIRRSNDDTTRSIMNKSISSTATHEFLSSDHASPEVVADESNIIEDDLLPVSRRLQKVVSLKIEESPSDLSPMDENLLYPVRTLIPLTAHTHTHQLESAQSTVIPETEVPLLDSIVYPVLSATTTSTGVSSGTSSPTKLLDQLSKLAILTLQAPTNFEFCTLVMTFPISLLLHLMMPSLDKCSLTEAGSVVEFSRCFPRDFQLYLSVILLWTLAVGETFSNFKLAAAVAIALIFVVVYYYLIHFKRQISNNEDSSNDNRRYPTLIQRHHFTSILVFILSLFVISKLVNIVVTILKSWTERFHISQSIMGITLFAWGNSIGDLVSNLAFSKSGVIDTALGACFGGPVLNLLFGIGFDGTLVLLLRQFGRDNDESQRGLPALIEFDIDSHLLCSSVGIAVAVFIYVVIVPINKWKIDRRIGILLLADYLLVSMVNVYMEITN